MTRPPTEGPQYAPRLTLAARTVAAGGVIAYPTEGVYGLGCLPHEDRALLRILQIKHRFWRKGLALIAAHIDQLEPFVVLPVGARRAEIAASWPGPVTWVLPARRGVSALVTGGRDTVAVRVTNHLLARQLCQRAGSALVSTSANRSRHAPLLTPLAVRRALGAELDYVLAGPLGNLRGPTPIRDAATGRTLRGA